MTSKYQEVPILLYDSRQVSVDDVVPINRTGLGKAEVHCVNSYNSRFMLTVNKNHLYRV